jgi:type VI secretion system lysozyme-like protein
MLLEKLGAGGGRRSVSLIESIVANLTNVLNTKRDFGSPLPDLGIRSLTEYSSRDQIALAVMNDVREAIEKYEPRLILEDIAIAPSDSPFRLSFTIHCSIIDGTKKLAVSFDTVFGSFAVER